VSVGRVQLGDLTVTPLFDGRHLSDPARTYAGFAPPEDGSGGLQGIATEDWLDFGHLLTADGQLEITFGGFLVRTASGRLVLVDTGVGPQEASGLEGGKLLDSLASAGHAPGDVTDVVFTHLHRDHTGYAVRDGRATFPNATYRCDVRDWDHFVGVDEVITANVSAIANRLETWDADGTIAPGVDVRPMPGHTPGSTVVVLSSGGQRALLLGDVVHCPAELVDDEWAGMADVDPVQAKRVRNALAQELETGDTLAASGHFPGLQFGRLWRTESNRQWSYLSARR
jgi:glyoxylase-like metal-dependent hydrolase (beta-lactamase superfamily II)